MQHQDSLYQSQQLPKLTDLLFKKMMDSQIENIEPNQSPQLCDLIRGNIQYQENQNIKNILYKESLVKISLDKDFENLFDRNLQEAQNESSNENNLIQVTSQIKEICNWLEQSQDFKGMSYIPYANLPKLLHILHQKVENTVIVVTQYHSVWIERMQEMARLYKIKWAFLNLYQSKQEKVKVLELYEMKKIKLLFISPSVFKFQEYLEFHSDLLVLPDLHLFTNSQHLIEKIVDKCNPGRFLALYSTLMKEIYIRSGLQLTSINEPRSQNSIFISLKCQNQEKFKTLLNYLQRNQSKRTLVVVRDKAQANNISKWLKLKSVTSMNVYDYLSPSQMLSFNSPQILSRSCDIEQKVLDVVYKSKNYEITISKYFDALRFANYDCIAFYSFVSVPHFIQSCPDTDHRLTLLSQDDYFKIRNQITSQHINLEHLTKIVMKIMQKPRKKETSVGKKFYSDYVDDRLDMYSISKQFAQKNQQKVIRINWFCKAYDVNTKSFKKVIDGLCKSGVVTKDCKLVYQIEIEQQSLMKFRKFFPQTIEVRRRVNLLNLSTAVQKTTRVLLEDLKNQQISFKVTEKALQLRINKSYEEVQWNELWKIVNKQVTENALDLDRSYLVYKDCSYGSVELTRRQKCLQRKKDILNFYSYQKEKHQNIFDSSHKSNLLGSEIQQWIRHSNDGTLDEHQLILLLQGVETSKIVRFKDDPIFGRYKRYRYEDLTQVVQKIYKNKKVKR